MTSATALTLAVRDYECDMADGVSNAIYLHYLTHARLEFLKSGGVVYAELARQKISLVTTQLTIDFRKSLMSGDTFTVFTSLRRKGKLRLLFTQTIVREPDQTVMAHSTNVGTVVAANGRPRISPDLSLLLDKLSS